MPYVDWSGREQEDGELDAMRARPAPLFEQDYTGPRFRYGLRYRPLASWNVPDGWIIGSDRPHPEYPFGTVDYASRLGLGEVTAYELTLVATVGERVR